MGSSWCDNFTQNYKSRLSQVKLLAHSKSQKRLTGLMRRQSSKTLCRDRGLRVD